VLGQRAIGALIAVAGVRAVGDGCSWMGQRCSIHGRLN
jgi:hypothetical protein